MNEIYAVAQTASTDQYRFELTIRPEEWQQEASCAQVGGDLWFPTRRGDPSYEARKICAACPVQAACLEYAVRTKQRHGIWAGLTETKLSKVIRERRGS